MAYLGDTALELLATSPNLGFALALPHILHHPPLRRPWRAVRALLRKRQRVISEFLGFSPGESGRRILTKIERPGLSPPVLKALQRAMRDELWLKVLQHAPQLNGPAVYLAGHEALRRYSSPSLLLEIAQEHDICQGRRALWFLRDAVEMGAQLQRRPIIFHSLDHLLDVHDGLAEILTRVQRQALLSACFPPPPIPAGRIDEAEIIPITTGRELIDEAFQQHNCVVQHAHDVQAGRMYLYRVITARERATLSLVRGPEGWRLGELLARRNTSVAPATRRAVERWLASAKAMERVSRAEDAECDDNAPVMPASLDQDRLDDDIPF
ncbi:MAG: hypothetical protein NTW87_11840 [Planctomycetota bacterium]|nr:hypothetical protein [Planctomycetota bacterium]